MDSLIKYVFLFFPFVCNAQTEILIVGTMHDLPEGSEFNYQPILEITSAWKPDVICSEYRKPNDTISLTEVHGNEIFQKMDSVSISWEIDHLNKENEIKSLYKKLERKKDLNHRMQLRNLLHVTMDRGNAYFQNYLIGKEFELLSEEDQISFIEQYPMYH